MKKAIFVLFKNMLQLDSTATDRSNHFTDLPVLVMGVGNYLMSDDGIGVHAIHALQRLALPGNIELLDAGTATMSFLNSVSNRRKVVIIDAVKCGNKPGTLYRLSPDDIYLQRKAALSLHQVGIIEAVELSRLVDSATEDIIVYGIEPAKLECGMSLSPEVEASLPELIKLVCRELEIETYT